MQHAAPRQDGCRLNAFVEWLSTRLSTRTVGKLNRPCRTLQRPFLRHQGEGCRNDQASQAFDMIECLTRRAGLHARASCRPNMLDLKERAAQ